MNQALENDVDQVQHHLGALERIVQARGGVETLDFDLQRIFTWWVHPLTPLLVCANLAGTSIVSAPPYNSPLVFLARYSTRWNHFL